ncbi:MAG: AAA-associated domain-containing protein [Candidatus Micrarchaeaceae archaeon]
MSSVRAILHIIDQNNNISLRELATHTKQNIDKLLPLLFSCSSFGFVKISKNKITITSLGKNFLKHPYSISKKTLKKIEVFKYIFLILKESPMNTLELTQLLIKKKVLSGNVFDLTETLRYTLNSWCVNTNILSRDHKKDIWHIKSKYKFKT